MRRRIVAATVAAAALAGTLAACGGGDTSSSASKATVVIKTFEFTPHALKVRAGTTVAFRNDDAINHTVTSGTRKGESTDTPDGRFDVLLKTKGATGTVRLTQPGTYTYYCKIHPGPGMTGEIVVQ